WLGSSSVVCWLGIACPPVTWCFCSYPRSTKDKSLAPFSAKITPKDAEPPELAGAWGALRGRLQDGRPVHTGLCASARGLLLVSTGQHPTLRAGVGCLSAASLERRASFDSGASSHQ